MAETSPGIVNSFACMSGRSPSWRSVADVTGPMEASSTSFSKRCNFGPREVPSSATKFFTVDELVNITTCGRIDEFFITLRSFTWGGLGGKEVVYFLFTTLTIH